MAISDKLLQINQAKQDIKEAIENKGVDLTDVAFSGYAEKIDEIPLQKEEQPKTVTDPNFSSGDVVVTPDSGKVLSQVTVVKDNDLVPENIVKDVDIFGVVGTAETVMELTQAQYDALSVYDDNTYHLVSDALKIYKGAALLYENLSIPKFVFYGGWAPHTVIKADLGNLSTTDTSVKYIAEDPYGFYSIQSILVDDEYIYVGGSSTNRVRKYLKSNMSYVGESPDYGGVISAMAMDDTHIYVGGATTQRVRKYLKSNLSYVSQATSFDGNIISIAIDDTHIYVGGMGGYTVRKYLKSNMSQAGESESYGNHINAIAVDDEYVYAGGHGKIVIKYLKSDLSYVSESPDTGNRANTIAIDDTHIYVAGGRYVKQYLKSNFSYIGQSPDYGDNINSIAIG